MPNSQNSITSLEYHMHLLLTSNFVLWYFQEEFPVKLKVVFQTNKSLKKLIVKEYLLDKCAKGEPVNITIKENGHIVIQDKNQQDLYVKTDNDSRRLEFQEDASETGLGRYYECDDSKLEPFSIPTIDTIDQEMTIARFAKMIKISIL